MLRVSLTALAVATAVATFSTTSASAQDRYYDRGTRAYRSERVAPQQYNYGYGPRVNGRRDPSSYDGYRTGNPRTCGSDFFRYDDRGVPYGPYCN